MRFSVKFQKARGVDMRFCLVRADDSEEAIQRAARKLWGSGHGFEPEHGLTAMAHEAGANVYGVISRAERGTSVRDIVTGRYAVKVKMLGGKA